VILPTKHLSQDRALLTVGARLIEHLSQPKTVSALWEEISSPGREEEVSKRHTLRYDAFVLALDLLFLIETIELRDGLLSRKAP